MWCPEADNAKQFKVISTVLKKVWSNVLTSNKVNDFSTNQEIEWKFVTWSDKKELITHLQALRYTYDAYYGFKFLKCCSLPMNAAMGIRFSHYLKQLLTFNIIQNTRNQQQSFPPFYIVFKPKFTAARQGSLIMGGVEGGGRARVYFK